MIALARVALAQSNECEVRNELHSPSSCGQGTEALASKVGS